MLFPRLSVLDALTGSCRDEVHGRFANAVFVCLQHLLETTGSLIEALLQLGARPEAIHLLGKCYSTGETVVEKIARLGVSCYGGSLPPALGEYETAAIRDVQDLWQRVLDSGQCRQGGRLVVLDDGGRCLSAIPKTVRRSMEVVGAEQTTSGVRMSGQIQCPTIEVARCAVKRFIEPPMIASAVFSKIADLMRSMALPETCGVVGFGPIGRAVAVSLIRGGHDVHVCDPDFVADAIPREMKYAANVQEVLHENDCLFGCTGNDITQPRNLLQGIQGKKLLISCASEDQEFRTLLRSIHGATTDPAPNPMDTLTYRRDDGKLEVQIFRGGFPVNFDGSGESVKAADIQLTRGLLLGAVIQAVMHDTDTEGDGPSRVMLHPAVQRYVVERWRNDRKPDSSDYPHLRQFTDMAWIGAQSHGRPATSNALIALFGESSLCRAVRTTDRDR